MYLKYRRYYYGGGYSDEELTLPDSTIMWKINQVSVAYKVEEERWTKDYVIVTDYSEELYEKFIRISSTIAVVKFADKILTVMTAVHLYDALPLKHLSEVQYLLNGIYLKNTRYDEVSMEKEEFRADTEEWLELLRKYANTTMSISRAIKFTEDGIEAATVYFKTYFTFQDNRMFEVEVIPYKQLGDFKINTDSDSIREYRDRVIEIFKVAL